jgi:hypothetical protein
VLARNRGGAYVLCELDGTLFHRPYAAFRLVPYFARRTIALPDVSSFVDVPSALDELVGDNDAGIDDETELADLPADDDDAADNEDEHTGVPDDE